MNTDQRIEVTVCLNCGMGIDEAAPTCPKCDNDLGLQHDGSTITVDIAHSGEHVSDALRKMQCEVDAARKGVARRIRFIVGSGLIREQVLLALRDLEFRGEVKDFDLEASNRGAILVTLK